MARTANPNRDKAKELYVDSGGKLAPREIAARIGETSAKVRKWKCAGKWDDDVKKKKRKPGAPYGNKNAAYAGAPYGNTNAETHGAYTAIHLETLSPEAKAYVEGLTLDSTSLMLMELQLLVAKERDLRIKITKLESDDTAMFRDRTVNMSVPKGSGDDLKTTMETTVNASAFDHVMKLEGELDKTHGRIIKLIDSIKGYEMECRRLDLEERKHSLNKQRAAGQYDVGSNGEINDEYDADLIDDPTI